MIHRALFIDNTSNKGKGVFANRKIKKGTVIEISPVIVMSAKERKLIDKTKLHDYIFIWGKNEDECCMAQGYISVYNHSYTSNCEYFMIFEQQEMFVKTVRDIEAGEELTLNYNGTFDNKDKVWFDVKD